MTMSSSPDRAATAAAPSPTNHATEPGASQPPRVALVVGAGDATGAAVARRFAREGLTVCAVRRDASRLNTLIDAIRADGGTAHGHALDVRDEHAVVELVERIERDIGAIDAMVFNVGVNARASLLEQDAAQYAELWRTGCFSAMLCSREVARRMVPRGRGCMIFTGATASLRGSSSFAAFAGAKHALRALAQSAARELAPHGVHVAHLVVDAAIDTAFIREHYPQRYALKADAGIVDPAHIADIYWNLYCQPRDAWTHELDVRPWSERW